MNFMLMTIWCVSKWKFTLSQRSHLVTLADFKIGTGLWLHIDSSGPPGCVLPPKNLQKCFNEIYAFCSTFWFWIPEKTDSARATPGSMELFSVRKSLTLERCRIFQRSHRSSENVNRDSLHPNSTRRSNITSPMCVQYVTQKFKSIVKKLGNDPGVAWALPGR